MVEPTFRLVCLPGALIDTPEAWARELLGDGEIALLPDRGGLQSVDRVAHALGLVSVEVLRGEDSDERQQETVIAYADGCRWCGSAPRSATGCPPGRASAAR